MSVLRIQREFPFPVKLLYGLLDGVGVERKWISSGLANFKGPCGRAYSGLAQIGGCRGGIKKKTVEHGAPGGGGEVGGDFMHEYPVVVRRENWVLYLKYSIALEVLALACRLDSLFDIQHHTGNPPLCAFFHSIPSPLPPSR